MEKIQTKLHFHLLEKKIRNDIILSMGDKIISDLDEKTLFLVFKMHEQKTNEFEKYLSIIFDNCKDEFREKMLNSFCEILKRDLDKFADL